MDAAMEVPFPISPEDSMVPEPWNQLCRVVFTEDVELERGIQVRSGEDYLFSYFSDGFETVKVSLFGITEDGFAAKVSYEAHEDEPRPYVTECDVDEDEPYYGVFRDTTLYQDLELTQEACQLSAGLFGPRDGFSARLASDPFEDLDAESYTYRLTMGGLAEVCNGHQETFMASYKLEFGGVRHNALPIDFMYRPK